MVNANKERIAVWDNVKFVLILCVVIGHFADYYTKGSANIRSLFFYIYLFHMPAFIFLSGLFSKNVILEKRYSKILGCFSVYVVMKALFFLTTRCLNDSGVFRLFIENGVPWFIFAIGVFYFLTMLLQRVEKRYVLFISILLACFAGYDESVGDLLVVSRIIAFYPFFYIGFLMQPDEILNVLKAKHIWIVSAILLMLTAYVCVIYLDKVYWIRPLITGRNSFLKLGNYAMFGCVLRFLWYISSFALTFALISVTPTATSFISTIGKRSLQIYALHYLMIYAWHAVEADFLMRKIWPEHWKVLSVIVVPTIVTVLLSNKIFEKPFQWILNPRVITGQQTISMKRKK